MFVKVVIWTVGTVLAMTGGQYWLLKDASQIRTEIIEQRVNSNTDKITEIEESFKIIIEKLKN